VYPTTRNELIATPVIVGNYMYIATGQDPEHGEGPGHIWCVDISKGRNGNDLSLQLDAPAADPKAAGNSHKGVSNPNSAVVWHFAQISGATSKVARKDRMNRSISTAAVADGICFAPDFSGFLHVFDAATGEVLWTYDMEAAMWGSPLVADGKVYLCNEEGAVVIFEVSRQFKKLGECSLGSASYCSPIFANGVLYVTSRAKLFAIQSTQPQARQ